MPSVSDLRVGSDGSITTVVKKTPAPTHNTTETTPRAPVELPAASAAPLLLGHVGKLPDAGQILGSDLLYIERAGASGADRAHAINFDALKAAVINGLQTGPEALTADRTYYVRPDGNDANDGLANTAAGAFRTIQAAINHVRATIDLNGKNVVIQIADGVWTSTEVLAYFHEVKDSGTERGFVTLRGNVASPSSCVLAHTGGGFTSASFAPIYALENVRTIYFIEGFRLQSSRGAGVYVEEGSEVYIGDMDFGAVNMAHIFTWGFIATYHPKTFALSKFTITGGGRSHVTANGKKAYSDWEIGQLTLVGTLNFSWAFFRILGAAEGYIYWDSAPTGAATGAKLEISDDSVIYDSYTTDLAWLPGDSFGSMPGLRSSWLKREAYDQMTANQTFYVRPDGDDLNVGTENTAAGAFKTVQRAMYVIGQMDPNGFDITVQVGAGNYAFTKPLLLPAISTTGKLLLTGDLTTPSNVTFNRAAGFVDTVINDVGAVWSIGGFKLVSPGGGYLLRLAAASTMYWHGNMEFGNGGYHVRVDTGATLFSWGADNAPVVTISGNAWCHVISYGRCFYDVEQIVITAAMSVDEFVLVMEQAYLDISFNNATPVIGGENVIGLKFDVRDLGILETWGQAVDFLPGTVAGTVAAHGIYR